MRNKEEFIRKGLNKGFKLEDLMDFSFQNLKTYKDNLKEMKGGLK